MRMCVCVFVFVCLLNEHGNGRDAILWANIDYLLISSIGNQTALIVCVAVICVCV